MTGGALLGLILISMGWLFFLAGVAINYQALRRSRKAKPGEPAPAGVPLLAGVIGSVTVFFSIPVLAGPGVEVPWPWLWVLLPLLVDPNCAPAVFRLLRK